MPAIVVYDGLCGLCSRLVRWIVPRDRDARFRFASQQSQAGAALLREHGVDPARPHTILLIKDGRAYFRSEAIVEIASDLPGWTTLARLLRLVPRRVRDRFYGCVARHRYRWFGKLDRPAVPAPEARERFLE